MVNRNNKRDIIALEQHKESVKDFVELIGKYKYKQQEIESQPKRKQQRKRQ